MTARRVERIRCARLWWVDRYHYGGRKGGLLNIVSVNWRNGGRRNLNRVNTNTLDEWRNQCRQRAQSLQLTVFSFVSLKGIIVAVDVVVADAIETNAFTNDDEESTEGFAARRFAIMDRFSVVYMANDQTEATAATEMKASRSKKKG
jgi:hypothetical protein